jgi:hypothetical protein
MTRLLAMRQLCTSPHAGTAIYWFADIRDICGVKPQVKPQKKFIVAQLRADIEALADEIRRTATADLVAAAVRKYREHKQQTDPTWLEGKGNQWSLEAQREAMRWRVASVVM